MNTATLASLTLLGLGLAGCIDPPPTQDPPSDAQLYCEEELAASAEASCAPQLEALTATKRLDATIARRLARFCDELHDGPWGDKELDCMSQFVRESTDLSTSWARASRTPSSAHAEELISSCEGAFALNDGKVACVRVVLLARLSPITDETSLSSATNAVNACADAFVARFPDSSSSAGARLNWLRAFTCAVDNAEDGSYGQVSTWLEECAAPGTSTITLPDELPTCLLGKAGLSEEVCE